jgi:hypothetical protein
MGRAKVNNDFSDESEANELHSQGHEENPKQEQGAVGDRVPADFFYDERDTDRAANGERDGSDQTEES